MQSLKKALFVNTFVLLLATTSFGQAQPSYTLNTSHPAYSTGATFNTDPEFLRGWCFAWDATSPVAQSGRAVSVFTRTINISAANYIIIPVTIWSSGDFYITVNVSVKITDAVALRLTQVFTPDTSLFWQNAQGIKEYVETALTDPAEKSFWMGYASCLELASQNPAFLLISQGNTI